MGWIPGAYIAEDVAPWIDASGNLVAATGGAAVGTSPPGSSDTPSTPSGAAQAHHVQPKKAATGRGQAHLSGWHERDDEKARRGPTNPHHPTPAYRPSVVHEPTRAHPTALLTGHSHAKVVAESTPAHTHLPLGNLSQTMKRFIEFGTSRPVRHPDGHDSRGFLSSPMHELSRVVNFYAHATYGARPQDEKLRHNVEALQQAGEYANRAASARNPGLIKREEEERIARLRERIAKPREEDEYGGGGDARPAEESGGMPSGIGGGTQRDESWTKPKHRRWWNA